MDKIEKADLVLNDRSQCIAVRFRSLFVLRNLKTEECIQSICKCLLNPDESSALLKHELAYCLGQTQNPAAVPCLIKILQDSSQDPMVRHESAEALGAIGRHPELNIAEILRLYKDDPILEVAQTCDLALRRIEWLSSKLVLDKNGTYDSVDPVPSDDFEDIGLLSKKLIDLNQSLWERYRAMFSLRNSNTDQAIIALTKGLECKDSVLFRHEVAYVLGQIQSPLSVEALKQRLFDPSENYMVRHEAAEAIGSIASSECKSIIEGYLNDKEPVVRESCEVALDMINFEQSGEFQYAKIEL